MSNVSKSTSVHFGLPPAWMIDEADEVNVSGDTATSFPFTSNHFRERKRAAVHEETATANVDPTYFANSSSNCSTSAESVRSPESITRPMARFSSSPTYGLQKGMLVIRFVAFEEPVRVRNRQ